MSKELVEIVRCKNCIHRPIKGEEDVIRDITYPPKNSRGHEDFACPCLNEDDYWYSWYPSDDWFCANGEMKGDEECQLVRSVKEATDEELEKVVKGDNV